MSSDEIIILSDDNLNLDISINSNDLYINIDTSEYFNINDFWILILITFISFWTRNFIIQFPDQPVFDEIHFGTFTNNYINSTYFFDIHPPLAKILIFLFSKANQYKGNLNFSLKYFENLDYIGLRQIPALFSSFCPSLIYLSCKCFKYSTISSLTASIMILCENSMITESRFLLTDGILHFFICLTIFSFSIINIFPSYSIYWFLSLIINGIFIGFSISSKLTSLSLIPLCGLFHIINILNETNFKFKFLINLFYRYLLTFLPMILIFYYSYVLHLILLPFNGPGDAFMNYEFKLTLLNKSSNPINWNLRNDSPSLFKRIIHLNLIMHSANMRIKANHPYSSLWYQWPILKGKWILFWVGRFKTISCLLNPFNVFLSSLSILIISIIILFYFILPPNFKKKIFKILFFTFGYYFSLIPFCLINRVLFLYHYIIPLIFAILNLISFIELFFENYQKIKSIILTLIQIIIILSFIYWAPITYGLELKNQMSRKWLNSW